jgi:hypothetical protein
MAITGWVFADSVNYVPQGPANSIQHKVTGSQFSGSANYTYVVAATSADEDRLALDGTVDAGFGGAMLHGNPHLISKNARVLDGYYVPIYGNAGVVTILDGATVTVGDGAEVKILDWDDV